MTIKFIEKVILFFVPVISKNRICSIKTVIREIIEDNENIPFLLNWKTRFTGSIKGYN